VIKVSDFYATYLLLASKRTNLGMKNLVLTIGESGVVSFSVLYRRESEDVDFLGSAPTLQEAVDTYNKVVEGE